MLSPYYYVMSSLPYLDLKIGKGGSISGFFDNIEIALSREDFLCLKDLSESRFARGNLKVIDQFLEFEEMMRYTLATIRAEKLGFSRDVYLESSYFSSYYLGILKPLCLKENPFEVELGLDMLKWQFLTELEVGNDFNFEKLVIYLLKLMLVSRRSLFIEEIGEKNFDDICQKLSMQMSKNF
ncbi:MULTISPECIES: DUF2764 family protein [Borrelia]|uniref:DUF2764 domain-containing protein n=2 Tax=Borrelia turicatae TaxID=142 RepID=A0A172XAE0_BORTU|nr:MULTISPECIES: DUF2764 family protein [Borrelia]AAX17436.1 hypothetical protein BT0095 [Borrelia turicatae 91E135]ANF33603.1 hypothetical protein A7978_00460 [Borrelia turicatae]UPA11798.1 DUF2764 family protein [Borrelia venezuelensis]UPA12973.1 DUF2764 family protein [Borrelia turicatae 91E135]UPA14460.1 DUF2764 family protein [Borrelia turicatae]